MKNTILARSIALAAAAGLTLFAGNAKATATPGTNASYTGSLQTYTVTLGGYYNFSAAGAAGGTGYAATTAGGAGASISGTDFLASGTILDIYIGGTGGSGTQFSPSSYSGGGGGGGTFITDNLNNPLMVAGGGGGAGGRSVTNAVGAPGVWTQGSTNGSGGTGSTGNAGAGGGAGFNSSGTGSGSGKGGTNGTSYAGGAGSKGTSNQGGFGGGGGGGGTGSAGANNGGGGGGYNGGNAGGGGGGGGTSFTAASFTSVTGTNGANSGNGFFNLAFTLQNYYLGSNSSGQTMSFTNGTTKFSNSYVGNIAGDSNNVLTVANTNTLLTNTADLTLGKAGNLNSMVISNGGVAANVNGWIGISNTASNNSVLVTGASSSWSNSGTLNIGVAGSGSLTVANGGNISASGITIAASNGSTGTLNIGGFRTNDTSGTITAATIAFGSGTGSINFNQSGSTTLTNRISGAGSVNQLGSGSTTLSGSNTYSGTTTVNSGALLANNTAGSAVGTSVVTVSGNGTLGGNGSIGGATTIATGGTLTPGSDGVGSLTFTNGLTIQTGAATTFRINSTNNFTSINLIGSTLSYGGDLVFNITSYTPAAEDAFTLFNMTGGDVQSGDFTSVSAGSLIFTDASGIWSATDGFLNYQFSDSTGQLTVANAVPEPSTYALFGIGAIGILMVMRRKKAI